MRKVFMNRKKGSFEVWSVEVKGKLHGVKKKLVYFIPMAASTGLLKKFAIDENNSRFQL